LTPSLCRGIPLSTPADLLDLRDLPTALGEVSCFEGIAPLNVESEAGRALVLERDGRRAGEEPEGGNESGLHSCDATIFGIFFFL